MLPISLKVNLEIAKLFFSFLIERDKSMPGIQVRTSSIPEELGRIAYLLTDKTGTLTKNEMVFKKVILQHKFMFNFLFSFTLDLFLWVKILFQKFDNVLSKMKLKVQWKLKFWQQSEVLLCVTT